MNAVLLARLQFALTAGFHFLYPPTTLGLSLVILMVETLSLRGRREEYRELNAFLVKLLGALFVVGTATGITLEFAFGTNWAEYSRTVGNLFGPFLAAEGIFAFFLESVFLGVLLFGRNRVSARGYWWSTLFLFLGSHLSALWILVANSWMQTPRGYRMEGKIAVLEDFWEALFNPSTLIRFAHTLSASWVTGSLVCAAIGAWLILKGSRKDHGKRLLRISLFLFAFSGVLQLFLGHGHSVQVAKTQPEKMAAFEGLWETQRGAPLSLFGIPDQRGEKTRLSLGVPNMLSLLTTGDPEAEVKGLKEYPREDRPPVLLSFAAYHVMIGLGSLFFLGALFALYFLKVKGEEYPSWFLKALLFSVPLPYIANEAGWVAAEVGRQPWVIYHVLRTSQAASVNVPAWQVLLTLSLFTLLYLFLFVIFLKVTFGIVLRFSRGEGQGEGY